MKLRWPTRYEVTRVLLAFGFVGFALSNDPNNVSRDTAVICAVICGAAYLIAGLLKPLHDSTGEDA